MIRKMLYGGIINDPSFNKVDASGGEISYFHQYKIHTFNYDGIFQVNAPGDVSILIVGGGGRGGKYAPTYGSPGGGGGEVLELNIIDLSIGLYDVCVGYGAFDPSIIQATLSSFNEIIANPGKNASDNQGPPTWKAGDSGSGKLGFTLYNSYWAGGGAGDTEDGHTGGSTTGGAGGYGKQSLIGITYTNQYLGYGGGGGGWGSNGGGTGYDGGGQGGGINTGHSEGTKNTGGGGGGMNWYDAYRDTPPYWRTSLAGGDGVVIIRYRIE